MYLIEALLLQGILSCSPCIHDVIQKRIKKNFSSETLQFVRRVRSSQKPMTKIERLCEICPQFIMKIENYDNESRFKSGAVPHKTAAARLRLTFWKDDTRPLGALTKIHHAKLNFTKKLCFDGFSTSSFLDRRRQAFISKHQSQGNEFQVYSEIFQIDKFEEYGIWSQPRNIFIGTLPYMIFTIAGLSWIYRVFVEIVTTPFNIEIVKTISINDRSKEFKQVGSKWKLVR